MSLADLAHFVPISALYDIRGYIFNPLSIHHLPLFVTPPVKIEKYNPLCARRPEGVEREREIGVPLKNALSGTKCAKVLWRWGLQT